MLNIDKSELEGFKSGRSSGATTTDFDSELERSARAFREEDLFDTKRKSKLQAETKEIDPTQLQRPVERRGFIRFADYQSKLRMMDTALFLFGLKMHR